MFFYSEVVVKLAGSLTVITLSNGICTDPASNTVLPDSMFTPVTRALILAELKTD